LADAEGMGEQLTEMVAKRLDIETTKDIRADLLVRLVRAGAQTAQRQWIVGNYKKPLTDLMTESFRLLRGPLLDEWCYSTPMPVNSPEGRSDRVPKNLPADSPMSRARQAPIDRASGRTVNPGGQIPQCDAL
jgi:MftR C-terminal domain